MDAQPQINADDDAELRGYEAMKRDRKTHGYVLIATVVLILTLALIGASLIVFFSSVNVSARSVVEETKAFYLAEAGIAYAVFTLRSQASMIGDTEQVLGPIHLGEGTFIVSIDFIQALITSTGDVNDVQKTLQMQFSAL